MTPLTANRLYGHKITQKARWHLIFWFYSGKYQLHTHIKVILKYVMFALKQAKKAQSSSRGIALLFL